MNKISKKDQDPNQVDNDAIALAALKAKKSKHFTVGSWVISNGVRGEIVGMSKDGGSKLLVVWENCSRSAIDNPHFRGKLWRG